MRNALLIGVLIFSGCASPTLTRSIDYSNITITSIAETVREECGNTVPDGDCLPTSLITTDEKNGIKADLLRAAETLDLAEIARIRGDADTAANRIDAARLLLSQVRQYLEERGVE